MSAAVLSTYGVSEAAPPWVVAASGRRVSLSAPAPGQILIGDIAAHLARLPRFLGATRKPYSVAQHSCLVADILRHEVPRSPWMELAGLLHDAHEAYVGDIVTPVGWVLGIEGRQARELSRLKARMDAAIWSAVGLPRPDWHVLHAVKRADQMAFRAEWCDLMPGACPGAPMEAEWAGGIEPVDEEAARGSFLDRFRQLMAALRETERAGEE
jgi:hypothetical protein